MAENFFTRKHGGIEMWMWIAFGVGGMLIYTAYRRQATPPPGGPASVGPDTQSPYVFLLPQNAVAGPDASDVTGSYPSPGRVPGGGPSRANPTAFGFEWSPYTVLGLQETRRSVADTSPAGIATTAYGLKKDDTANATYLATLITANNPALDWSRPLPIGATVMIPKLNVLPDGAEATQYN